MLARLATLAVAMVVALNQRGLFSWSEWAQALGAEIAAGPKKAGNAIYFENWLSALEKLLVGKGAASKADLVDVANSWREAALATPHGHPIVLAVDGSNDNGANVKGATKHPEADLRRP